MRSFARAALRHPSHTAHQSLCKGYLKSVIKNKLKPLWYGDTENLGTLHCLSVYSPLRSGLRRPITSH